MCVCVCEARHFLSAFVGQLHCVCPSALVALGVGLSRVFVSSFGSPFVISLLNG